MNAAYVSNRDSDFVIFIALALIFFPKRNYIYINTYRWMVKEHSFNTGKFCTDYTFFT